MFSPCRTVSFIPVCFKDYLGSVKHQEKYFLSNKCWKIVKKWCLNPTRFALVGLRRLSDSEDGLRGKNKSTWYHRINHHTHHEIMEPVHIWSFFRSLWEFIATGQAADTNRPLASLTFDTRTPLVQPRTGRSPNFTRNSLGLRFNWHTAILCLTIQRFPYITA